MALKRLFVPLNLFFNAYISHCYLPQASMDSVFVSLIKNKSDNLLDVNNYRSIALSNSVTKIVEILKFDCIVRHRKTDCYQIYI